MSEDRKSFGQTVLGWWSVHLADRNSPQARALASKLRRASLIAVLSERQVQNLAQLLAVGPAQAENLARVVQILAEVREHDTATLASRLGGDVLSDLRFQRLMRAQGLERDALLRRAVVMADRRCNVAALAKDIWVWDDAARTRWCFHYYGAAAPSDLPKEPAQ